MENGKNLKKLAEDCAYTFKGLYKTSDWLGLEYKIYLSVPIIFSLVSLGFDDTLPPFYLKILAILSLIFTFLVILNQQDYSKIEQYRQSANKFKNLYDNIESDYHIENYSLVDNYKKQIDNARRDTVKLPISIMGRWWAKFRIEKEMNLKWLES